MQEGDTARQGHLATGVRKQMELHPRVPGQKVSSFRQMLGRGGHRRGAGLPAGANAWWPCAWQPYASGRTACQKLQAGGRREDSGRSLPHRDSLALTCLSQEGF